MKVNPDQIMVTPHRFWLNAHAQPPQVGTVVRALSRDGIDVGKVTWSRDSTRYYDGWAPLDSIPPDIKALQLKRYTDKYPELFKEKEDGQVSRTAAEGIEGSAGCASHDLAGSGDLHRGEGVAQPGSGA